MAIIVDTNCFANVFSRSSAKHNQFEPVLIWILSGKGMLVYGGSKYKKELKNASRYHYIFRLLKDIGKVINGDDNKIDNLEKDINLINKAIKFNDIHLLAISINTKCRIICSEDTSSIKFVTDYKYFPKGFKKPVYYTSKGNKGLLCDKYVDKSLKPLCRINKNIADKIYNNLPK